MRISLLMQREPFGDILTATLERFWQQKYDKPFAAKWIWKPVGNRTPADSMDLLCNIYLNAIFPSQTNNGALEPIRREFSRSVVRWRTPLQQAYCKLALSPQWAGFFKQAVVRVSPPHPSLAQQVIVPGNNKIRILDQKNDVAIGVLKHGFPAERFQIEINARRAAEQCGVPVPKLLESDAETGWFEESFVVGTPLNRIADASRETAIADLVATVLLKWSESTRQTTTVAKYVSEIRERIEQNCDRNELLNAEQKNAVHAAIDELCSVVERFASESLATAETHGDFQPANILVGDDANNAHPFWIIDWEYSGRRQAAYDLLTFYCQTRRGSGLAEGLQRFVDTGLPQSGNAELTERSRSDLANRLHRQRCAIILLLEDLDLRLTENKNRLFTRIDDGLSRLIAEIQIWNSCRFGKIIS